MATNIDEHTGKTTMGCFLVCEDVTADVTLTEDDKGDFYFYIKYSYSGMMSGSGNTNVGPLTGDTNGNYKPNDKTIISYSVTNWNLTDTEVSCNLSASIEYTGPPHMGPDSIFNNQLFSGPRRAVKLGATQERFEKRYAATNEALKKASGMSVADIVAKSYK